MLKRYYLITAFFHFFRALPHAILFTYFISKGVTISNYGLVQTLFFIGIVSFEIPSGVFSDLYCKKNVKVISLLINALAFVGVFLSSNIVFLIICYFIYGISSALDTGSIDAFIVNKLSQENNKEQLIKKFISYNNGFMLLAMIIGATTGIFLYQLIDGVIYLISATSFIILAFFVFWFFDKEVKSESNITIRSQFKKTFAVFNYKEGIFIFILIIIILQFPLQAIMQYWQILLKQINFNIQYNSIFYSLILFSTALFSYIFKFVNIKEKLLPIFMLIYLIGGLFFFLNNVIVMAIVFFIVTLANTFIMLFYNNKIQNAISSKQRSTITSTISFFSRIVSMVAMLVLTLFNRILNNPFSAFATVIFIGAISLFIVFFILQNSNSRQKVAFDANLDYKIPYHINLVTNYKKKRIQIIGTDVKFLKNLRFSWRKQEFLKFFNNFQNKQFKLIELKDFLIANNKKSHRHINNFISFLLRNKIILSDELIDMQDRYSRHNLYFEMIGNNNFNFLNSKTITLVGAGGIGTNIALLLTVAGIKKIYLVDDDIVELSNLTRQYIFSEKEVGQKKGKVLKKQLLKRNHNCEIEHLDFKISKDNYEEIALKINDSNFIIVSADSSFLVYYLINEIATKYKIPYSIAGYVNKYGIVGPLIVPEVTKCWNCIVPQDKKPTLKFWNSNFKSPSYGPLNSLVSSIQVNEILRYFANAKGIETLGKRMFINSESYQISFENTKKFNSCKLCFVKKGV